MALVTQSQRQASPLHLSMHRPVDILQMSSVFDMCPASLLMRTFQQWRQFGCGQQWYPIHAYMNPLARCRKHSGSTNHHVLAACGAGYLADSWSV